MIDYDLTFTKRGHKPYLTLKAKGQIHDFCRHFLHNWLIFFWANFFPKSKNNGVGKLIKYYLTFQEHFQK